jgi:hypothetical protein
MVVMQDVPVVRHRVRQGLHTVGLRQAAVHGKTIHGKAEQQEDGNNPAQGHLGGMRRL